MSLIPLIAKEFTNNWILHKFSFHMLNYNSHHLQSPYQYEIQFISNFRREIQKSNIFKFCKLSFAPNPTWTKHRNRKIRDVKISASQWLVTTRKPQKNKSIRVSFIEFIFIEHFCKLSFASNPTWIKHKNLIWLSGVFNQGKQLNCLFDKFYFWNYSSINSFTKMYKINLYVYSINYFPVNIFEFIKFLPL